MWSEADSHLLPIRHYFSQLLLDLRHMPVRGDAVGIHSFCYFNVEVTLLRPSPSTTVCLKLKHTHTQTTTESKSAKKSKSKKVSRLKKNKKPFFEINELRIELTKGGKLHLRLITSRSEMRRLSLTHSLFHFLFWSEGQISFAFDSVSLTSLRSLRQ